MADGQYYIDLVNAKIGKKTEVRGIVRDVLWEKFSWSGWMDNLAEHEKSPVVDPVVIEIEADTAAILGISYIAVFVIVITFLCFKLWDFYRRRGGTTL